MATLLNDKEIRVLGCLIEKEMATPEYYPLSLNALVNACNQKSNRTPVVSYDETTVILALDSLKDKKFVWRSDASRVTKYSQNFVKINNLIDKEAALICLLLLRGPQTLGELRGRSDRLYKFNNLEEVQSVLNGLGDMGIVMKLPKQPGRKEVRYIHLLAGEPDLEMEFQEEAASLTSSQTGDESCITDLEKEIKSIREELNTLQQDFLDFKNQFE
jgi:uncharacterized protein YceH (UPF0502 family)